ncbi:hypothetical protein PP175_26040 (plasmid) [Aneurinibacillus sp. Ricciae_BoGa-3]|uniref:hypothetical protein n=1 Tax=Aneurinibacillus sp. Ricciae_BoGa-3 TaxID=3022697 RepID=UPI0023409818|nr:hypothetical protein [Aneurinibacillus sp. Ricciae_BoGa-3]WCK57528.1 hypothetical protein PP175_26040 [Aneurinibacillus sp. Ricciae_BoGa-3]
MSIKELPINKAKSIEFFRKSKDLIQKDTCYANSRIVLTEFYPDEFQNGTYRIGYGYYTSIKNGGFVRHCFIVDDKNEVIDVTAVYLDSEELFLQNEHLTYVCFAQLNTEQYAYAFIENDCHEDLKKPLQNKEREIPEYFDKKNYHVMLRDVINYLNFEPEIKYDNPETWTQEIKDNIELINQMIRDESSQK